jgi:hypothetical protein
MKKETQAEKDSAKAKIEKSNAEEKEFEELKKLI